MYVGVLWFGFACPPTPTDEIYTRGLSCNMKHLKKKGWKIETPPSFRASLHHGPWKMMAFPMVWFLEKAVYKAFRPMLGVNQMWTKRIDNTPKNESVDIL